MDSRVSVLRFLSVMVPGWRSRRSVPSPCSTVGPLSASVLNLTRVVMPGVCFGTPSTEWAMQFLSANCEENLKAANFQFVFL